MKKGTWKQEDGQWWLHTESQRYRGMECICEFCGRAFPTAIARKRRFCSNLCSLRARTPVEAAAYAVEFDPDQPLVSTYYGNPRWGKDTRGQWWELRDGKPFTRACIRQCVRCGADFPTRPSSHITHCSKACSAADHSEVLLAKRGGKPGSKFIDAYGYVQVYFPEHPAAKRNRAVSEHRIVMEGVLGRYLFPYENVHHKDGVRSNNDPANLELWVKPQPAGQRAVEIKHCPTCTCNNKGEE